MSYFFIILNHTRKQSGFIDPPGPDGRIDGHYFQTWGLVGHFEAFRLVTITFYLVPPDKWMRGWGFDLELDIH